MFGRLLTISRSLVKAFSAIIGIALLAAFARTGYAHEAGYYGFQTPSQLQTGMDSLIMRATQVDVPAGAIFSIHLMKGTQRVATSRTVFSTAYKNLFIFTGAAVASFRPLGTNEAPGDNFPGAKLYTGTADLNDITQNPGAYTLFWELSDGYLAPTDKMLATSTASFSFVDLKLISVSAASRQSDQKPGSVLFYHRYTSNLYSAQAINTTISLTNSSPTDSVKVKVFFVGITDCQPFEISICLGSYQTMSFSMRDYDPQNTGYCIAIACDSSGVPTQFNWLTGNAQIRQTNTLTGQAFDSLVNAVAVSKRTSGGVTVTGGKGEMIFNDDEYDRLPTQLAADQIPSQAGIGSNANSTLLSVYRPLPDLSGGAINPKVDLTAYSSTASTATASQSIGCFGEIRLGSARFNPQLSTLLPSGKTGWVKLSANDSGVILGAQFTTGQFSSGASLRALFFASEYRIKVPISVPGC